MTWLVVPYDAKELTAANDALAAKCGALEKDNARLTKRLEEAYGLLHDWLQAVPMADVRRKGTVANSTTAFLVSPPPADSPVTDCGRCLDPARCARPGRCVDAGEGIGEDEPCPDVPDPLAATEARVAALDKAMRLRWGDYDGSLKAALPAPVAEPVGRTRCPRCGNNEGRVSTVAGKRVFECGHASCWPAAELPTQPEVAEAHAEPAVTDHAFVAYKRDNGSRGEVCSFFRSETNSFCGRYAAKHIHATPNDEGV